MGKLVTALTLLAAGLLTQPVYALGMGDIEVYSALNQPLEAEINLNSSRPGETDDMIVKLASEDAFLQAGVERPFYLTKLKFVVTSKPDGSQYIKVTTSNPLREPFVNFLVDVDWPRGRLVREYTVLLDPPVFASQQSAAAPAQSSAPVPVAEATPLDSGFSDIPDIETDSAIGEPALIDRGSDDSFGQDDDLFGDDLAANEENVEPALEDLPDIEMQLSDEQLDDLAEDDLTEDDLTEDDLTEDDLTDFVADEVDDFSSADDTDIGAELDTAYEGSDVEFEADSFQEEESADLIDGRLSDQTLPDIDIQLDDTIPYDQQATDVLLSQFELEDGVEPEEESFTSSYDTPEAESVSGSDDEGQAVDDTEYEVKSGDTLTEIASRYKEPDVSVSQAMLSILRNNPDAFIRGNINDVKKGYVLRVPDKDNMLQINSAEALQEVKQQTALWREYKSQFAGAASAEQDAQAADQLLISERDAETYDENAELSLLAPGRDADSESRASGQQDGLESGDSTSLDLRLAREQLEGGRLENIELQERVADLGEQLETMERLLGLKNEQLAQLQEQLREQELGGTEEGTANVTQDSFDSVADDAATDDSDITADESMGLTLQGDGDSNELDSLDEDFAAEDKQLELDDIGSDEYFDSESLQDVEQSEIDTLEQEFADDETLIDDQFEDEFNDEFNDGFDDGFDEQSDESLEFDEPLSAEADDLGASEVDIAETSGMSNAEVDESAPSGFARMLYDFLPPPFNKMAADLFSTPYGLGILALIVILLVGVPIALMRPKRPKPLNDIIGASSGLADDVSSAPAKASLGDRLKTIFAPLTGLFGGKSKSDASKMDAELSAAIEAAQQSDATTGPSDTEGELEETVKAVASGLDTGEDSEATGEYAATEAHVSAPVMEEQELPAEPEVEEEQSDDTTAEADVYLAYGLFDQAEELLGQALSANPEKIEYKGKLLETYFASSKKPDFERLAGEIHSKLGGRQSRIWDKAVAMGKEIAPENALFAAATDSGLKASDFVPAKPETADLDLSDAQGGTTPDIDFGDVDVASTDTDFDLDFGEADFDKTVVSPGPDALSGDQAVNFDETIADISPEDIDVAAASSETVVEEDEDDLAFDLPDVEPSEQSDADLDVDFNADELGLDIDDGLEQDEIGLPEPTIAMDVNTNFDLDDEAEEDVLEIDEADVAAAEQAEEDIEIAVEESSGNTDLDLDLADLKLDDITDVDALDDSTSELESIDADIDLESSTDTEFDIPMSEDTLIDAELDDDTTFSGDTDLDEVSTKLDLAKAYMDMGDFDGASSTLEEVMSEGSDGQRKEAEELLDQIN